MATATIDNRGAAVVPAGDGATERGGVERASPFAGVPVEELLVLARERAAVVGAAQSQLVDVVAELTARERELGSSVRQMVAWQCGLTRSESFRVCGLAARLGDLPVLSAEFAAGRLSEGVVDAIAGVATAGTEAGYIADAKVATGEQLTDLIRILKAQRRRRDPRAKDPERASELSIRRDDSNRLVATLNLRPEDAALFEQALENQRAKLAPTEADIDANPVGDGALRPDEKKPKVTRLDGLLALFELGLIADADDGLVPESHQIILRRNLDAHANPDGPCTLDGYGTLDDHLAGLLGCSALRIDATVAAGFVINTPTATRVFNRSQRRALRARDRHCRYPGCGAVRHLHAHHCEEWNETHRTSVMDGVLLCRFHHSLLHLLGHKIRLDDGIAVVTRPDGTELRGTTPTRELPDQPLPEPTGNRHTGTGEPLTPYAADTFLQTWHHHGDHDEGKPPEPPPPWTTPDPIATRPHWVQLN